MCISFDAIPVCDRQTDRQMETPPISKSCCRTAERDNVNEDVLYPMKQQLHSKVFIFS